MSPRLILAVLTLLGQTGCVAAIPMATELASSAYSADQLCSLAKFPGQSVSLCDRLPFNPAAETQTSSTDQSATNGRTVHTATR